MFNAAVYHAGALVKLFTLLSITPELGEVVSDDVRVGVIGHGGLLRAFSFARPIRGSGHV